MGLFNRVLKAISGKQEENNKLSKALFDLVSNYSTDVNQYNTQEEQIKTAYTLNPHVYAVINYITKAISQVPFNIYEVVDEKSYKYSLSYKNSKQIERAIHFQQKALKETNNDQLKNIIIHPNENQTWEEFIIQNIGYKLLTGNSYVYGLKPKGFNLFTKIYNIPSQLVSVELGKSFLEPIKGYNIGFDQYNKWQLLPEEILHRKYFNPLFSDNEQNIYGLSPLQCLKNVVLRTNNAKAASLAMFENGVPAGIITNESGISMTPEELKQMEYQFKNKFGSVGKNANKILFSSQKLGWQMIGMSSVDMEIISAEKHDLLDVCRVFGVPSVLISDNENSTYNNIEEAEKRFWSNTAIPEIESFIADLNKFILPAYEKITGKKYVIDYDIKGIPALQDDIKMLSDRLLKELEYGLWTPNEVRAMLDKPLGDSEHLNSYYINSNLNKINNDIQTEI